MFTLLMFNMCEVRKCTDITIINDATLEKVEFFFVILLTSNLDPTISLDPNVRKIEITDNDGLWNTHIIFGRVASLFLFLHQWLWWVWR